MIPWIVSTFAPIIGAMMLIPQVYHTYKTKRVKDLSLTTLLLLFLSNLLWFLHGYFIKDTSLIVSGVVNTILVCMLLGLYWKHS